MGETVSGLKSCCNSSYCNNIEKNNQMQINKGIFNGDGTNQSASHNRQQHSGLFNHRNGNYSQQSNHHNGGGGGGVGVMQITGQQINNKHIVNHIRATSSKSGVMSQPDHQIQQRIKQLQKMAPYSPTLNLKVLSSSTLQKGTVLKITAQGLISSIRGCKDGYTYFGCKKKNTNSQGGAGEILNDYIIPPRDKETANRHRGRHFQIQFDIPTNTYRIKDLGVGFGAFVRLEFPLVLKDNHLINMGESFVVVNLIENNMEQEQITQQQLLQQQQLQNSSNKKLSQQLRLKLFGGPATGQVYYFNNIPNEAISIGRLTTCDIQIDDNLLSKNQAHIIYQQNEGWVIIDGFNERPSTNGTWLYLNQEYDVYNGMIFKANQTLFQATLN